MDGKPELWVQRWLHGARATFAGAGRRLLRRGPWSGAPGAAELWVDRDGRILAGNEAAVTLYGYWPAELSRLSLSDLAAPAATGGDLVHRRKDDSRFFAEVEELTDQTEGAGIRLVRIHDVSERKQSQALTAMLEALEHSMAQGHALSDALQAACERLSGLFGFALVWVRATGPDGHLLGAGMAGSATEESLRVEAHVKLPLVAQGQQVGTLTVVQGRPVPFEPRTTALLHRFADGLAQALLAARASNEAGMGRRLAMCDPLTGLPNRRMLAERFTAAVEAVGPERPAALVLMDLDHFKQVNDAYGHPAGDRLLVQVAQALSEALRPQDLLVRLGGDEFLALLEGVTSEGAEAVAKRLREAASKVGMVELSCTVHPHLSAGVFAFHRPLGLDEAVQAADRALYAAKARGRNCVAVAAPAARVVPLRRRAHLRLARREHAPAGQLGD